MAQRLNLKKTKETIEKIVAQARESVKVLEALQKEGVARARALMQIPTKERARTLTNEKIVASLKKLGLASRSEVRDLERRVEELASELRSQITQVSKNARKAGKPGKSEKEDPVETDVSA